MNPREETASLYSGTPTSNGYNLSDDSSCTFLAAAGDQNNVTTAATYLGPLANNGSPHPDYRAALRQHRHRCHPGNAGQRLRMPSEILSPPTSAASRVRKAQVATSEPTN